MSKRALIIPFVFILFTMTVVLMKSSVKQILPKDGRDEMVGGVYSPYLLTRSIFYFIKEIDETVDLARTPDLKGKALLKLIFANKRLLEMDRLNREKETLYNNKLLLSYNSSIKKSIALARVAFQQGEEVEYVVWLIQESAQDQQRVFNKLIFELPKDEAWNVENTKNQSAEEIGNFLREVHGLNQKGL